MSLPEYIPLDGVNSYNRRKRGGWDHNFNLCSQGRLLIISLGLPKGTEQTHEICTQMNELAEKICKSSLRNLSPIDENC